MNSSQTPTARLLVKHWSMDDKETQLVTILHGGLVEGEFDETDVLALLIPEPARVRSPTSRKAASMI